MVEKQEFREILLKNLAAIGWTENEPHFAEAMILLASFDVGANEGLIAEALGLPSAHVFTVGERLRAGGIWVEDCVTHAGRWADSQLQFLLDVMVASGRLICRHDEDGEPRYKASESTLRLIDESKCLICCQPVFADDRE